MTERTTERRCASRRWRIEEHGIVTARIRPGHDAAVVDVSEHGVLIETPHRLLPGASVELMMETSTNKAAVRGRVLRSVVSCVRASSVSYRGAIGFERPLGWYGDHGAGSERIAVGEQRAGTGFRADATPQVV
jgi:hypothetical protein